MQSVHPVSCQNPIDVILWLPGVLLLTVRAPFTGQKQPGCRDRNRKISTIESCITFRAELVESEVRESGVVLLPGLHRDPRECLQSSA